MAVSEKRFDYGPQSEYQMELLCGFGASDCRLPLTENTRFIRIFSGIAVVVKW
jgi:hypothetical protein